MSNLPPGTSDNSRINEATPLLQEDELVIDDELYALGGAVGGSEEMDYVTYGSAEEMDYEKWDSSEELDYEKWGSAKKMDYEKRGSAKERDYEKRGSAKEMDYEKRGSAKEMDYEKWGSAKEMDYEKRFSPKERDYENRGSAKERDYEKRGSAKERDYEKRGSKEKICDAIRGSAEEIYNAIRGSAEIDAEICCSAEKIFDAIRSSKEINYTVCGSTEEIFDAIRSSTAEMKGAVGVSAPKVFAICGSTAAEVKDAVRDLRAKIFDAFRSSTAEMNDAKGDSVAGVDDAIGGSTAEINNAVGDSVAGVDDAIGGSKAEMNDAAGDSVAGVDDASGCDDESSSEVDEDLKNIVRALYSAWIQFPPKPSSETDEFEFFTPQALQALSSTWRHIKAQRDVLPEPKVIVQLLTETIVHYVYLRNLKLKENLPTIPEEEALVIARDSLTPRIAKLVEEGWQKVLDGIEKEDRERARKRKERRRKFRERMRKKEEVAEVLRFYAPFARLDHRMHIDCRLFCFYLCVYFSLYIFQIPIHTLLLGWPISIGVMGGLYMTQCPMSRPMTYVMMALGAIGTVALLLRMAFVIYQKLAEIRVSSHGWIVLKLIEFAFLDFLIVQLYYFFSETPSFVPGTAKYCNETFYNYVHWINYVSIALVSAWIFVYFTKVFLWWRSLYVPKTRYLQ